MLSLEEMLEAAMRPVIAWQKSFGENGHPSLEVPDEEVRSVLAGLGVRLRNNYPFHHPRYAGQMLKPPHPVAIAAYTAAMLVNPNNHALDGGPATARMEKEVVAQLARMVGFDNHLGHLTSSGTIANLEALFVARESHPGRGVAYSTEAHYTHSRMCHVLGVSGYEVAVDSRGRMDPSALVEVLEANDIGTVVVTLATTGLGAVDPLHEIIPIARERGIRVHVDAAYGGFFVLVPDVLSEDVARAYQALPQVDSVVIDPHKHGLQPYGCGAVLFADPAVGAYYKHDSPYTYFTSDEMHLGEISLECSRAGASAAALWATLKVLPLTGDGLGEVLRPGIRAARTWHGLLAESDVLQPYQVPDVDIVTYYPVRSTLSGIDEVSARIMHDTMSAHDDPIFLATLAVQADSVRARDLPIACDVPAGRILRSVLMKPQSEDYVPTLHERIQRELV